MNCSFQTASIKRKFGFQTFSIVSVELENCLKNNNLYVQELPSVPADSGGNAFEIHVVSDTFERIYRDIQCDVALQDSTSRTMR